MDCPVTEAVWFDVPSILISLTVVGEAAMAAVANALSANNASNFMMSSSKGTDTWSD